VDAGEERPDGEGKERREDELGEVDENPPPDCSGSSGWMSATTIQTSGAASRTKCVGYKCLELTLLDGTTAIL